jgi:hypothetical protein
MANLEDILAQYQTGGIAVRSGKKKELKTGRDLWDAVHHGGKERIGSVRLRDESGRGWKVRVRSSGKRGRYLKLTSLDGSGLEVRATADGYKPEMYRSITPEEWTVFALFAEGGSDWLGRRDDPALLDCVKELLHRLTVV